MRPDWQPTEKMLSLQRPSRLPEVQHGSSQCATQSRHKCLNLNLIHLIPCDLIWLLSPHILKEKTAALSPVNCMSLEMWSTLCSSSTDSIWRLAGLSVWVQVSQKWTVPCGQRKTPQTEVMLKVATVKFFSVTMVSHLWLICLSCHDRVSALHSPRRERFPSHTSWAWKQTFSVTECFKSSTN